MRHPAFESLPRLLLFLILNLIAGLTLAICLMGLLPVDCGLLVLDGVLYAILAGILTWLLWFAVAVADISGGQPIQRIVNHSALLFLALLIWTGGGAMIEKTIFTSVSEELFKAATLKTVYGFFLFLTTIRWYQGWRLRREQQEEEEEERLVQQDAIPVAPPMENRQPISSPVPEAETNAPVKANNPIETVTVKNGQKIHVVTVSDILFIQAEGDYVLIHTPDGRFLKEQTMKYFDENLPENRFVRIHRSCIVNKEEISKIELYEKQSYRITLKSGHQLRASATGYKSLKSALNI